MWNKVRTIYEIAVRWIEKKPGDSQPRVNIIENKNLTYFTVFI